MQTVFQGLFPLAKGWSEFHLNEKNGTLGAGATNINETELQTDLLP